MSNSRLAFSVTGAGFPVLLGHSYFFDRHMWAPQMAALSDYFTVITPDLWGHGESPALPAHVKEMADLAHDHLQLMDELGFKEFALVGLSVGGMWGAELASLASERVKALVLMDTFVGAEPEAQKARYFSMLDTANQLGAIPPAIVDYAAGQFYSDRVNPGLLAALKAAMAALPPQRLRQSIVPLGKMIFGRGDRLSLLSAIRSPSLVITGEHDQPRPISEGRKMAELLQCRHAIIPGAGHISSQENPEAVNQELLSFLRGVLP